MTKLMDLYYDMRVYQPIPFEEFGTQSPTRDDCEKRYDTIKKDFGDFKEKSLYDLCSANCFFGFRFLQDGGRSVVAVEESKATAKFVNALATEKGLPLKCFLDIEGIISPFDVGFYLDTHYHYGTEKYLEHIMSLCPVVYTSCAYSDRDNDFISELKKYRKNVVPIYTGYAQRTIYKCS